MSEQQEHSRETKPGDYLDWERLPPGGPLNRYSAKITRGHDFPGAQVCITSWALRDVMTC